MELRNTTFKYAVYKFLCKLEEQSDDKYFSNFTYDDILNLNFDNDSDRLDCFENKYKTQNKVFNKITQLLAISNSNLFYEGNNTSKNLCNFSETAINFIVDILLKYSSKDSTWKAIKKIDNTKYDGFIKAYQTVADRKKYISEVEFLINGFLGIAEDRFTKNSIQYSVLRDHLIMITQISQLKWMEQITSILYTSLPVTTEDIENSKLGILLNDRSEYFDILTKSIKGLVNNTNSEWQLLKNKRTEEFTDLTYNSKVSDVIDHLGEIAKELDPLSGEEFSKSLNNLPYNEKILTQGKAKKIIEKSFAKLSPEEQKLLLSNFCE